MRRLRRSDRGGVRWSREYLPTSTTPMMAPIGPPPEATPVMASFATKTAATMRIGNHASLAKPLRLRRGKRFSQVMEGGPAFSLMEDHNKGLPNLLFQRRPRSGRSAENSVPSDID